MRPTSSHHCPYSISVPGWGVSSVWIGMLVRKLHLYRRILIQIQGDEYAQEELGLESPIEIVKDQILPDLVVIWECWHSTKWTAKAIMIIYVSSAVREKASYARIRRSNNSSEVLISIKRSRRASSFFSFSSLFQISSSRIHILDTQARPSAWVSLTPLYSVPNIHPAPALFILPSRTYIISPSIHKRRVCFDPPQAYCLTSSPSTSSNRH